MNNFEIKDINSTSSERKSSFNRPESAPLSSMRPQLSNSKSVIKNLYLNNVTRNHNNNSQEAYTSHEQKMSVILSDHGSQAALASQTTANDHHHMRENSLGPPLRALAESSGRFSNANHPKFLY